MRCHTPPCRMQESAYTVRDVRCRQWATWRFTTGRVRPFTVGPDAEAILGQFLTQKIRRWPSHTKSLDEWQRTFLIPSSDVRTVTIGAGGSHPDIVRRAYLSLVMVLEGSTKWLIFTSLNSAHRIEKPKIGKDFYLHPETPQAGELWVLMYPENACNDRKAARDVKAGIAVFSPFLYNG
ncbi:hypothetical protein C8Q70DRAFT_707713 [Cubamyces menziesii]|nr:hypothetical protein C8Q70DRAFT_707713 [Cubamyces menziesii]